jgi:hypothetical protein
MARAVLEGRRLGRVGVPEIDMELEVFAGVRGVRSNTKKARLVKARFTRGKTADSGDLGSELDVELEVVDGARGDCRSNTKEAVWEGLMTKVVYETEDGRFRRVGVRT